MLNVEQKFSFLYTDHQKVLINHFDLLLHNYIDYGHKSTSPQCKGPELYYVHVLYIACVLPVKVAAVITVCITNQGNCLS